MVSFIAVVLGHFVGDYLLQNEWMAKNKSKPGITGYAVALVHCIIYTAAVALVAWHFSPLFLVLVFLSHYPIDRWSLATQWLRIIRGRTMRAAFRSTSPTREFDIAFSAIVYAVADNTMHLLLLWVIVNVLT